MSAAAEEAGEEIEWVVPAAAAAALLVLFQSFVAVLVVDAAGFGCGEGVVGFGYLDEFLGGGFIATGRGEGSLALAFRVEMVGEGRISVMEIANLEVGFA